MTPADLSAPLGAPVAFDGVAKRYGEAWAVRGFDLSIGAGEFVSLLGASGSGKTTSLMMLAGFETPSAGEIRVAGRSIAGLRPAARNIGMVFQSYALFPHMTVAENIAFPLRMRGMAKPAQAAAVARVLDIVGLVAFGDRRPMQLSGGQQQRVALARAIVFEPPVLLMDEPLGALDKHLRAHLQSEIKRIQTRLGLTVLYVTHDQEEALTMSDRICVMHDGAILQTDAPETLYDRPADIYVAGFFGDSNLLAAEAGPGGGLHAAGTFAPWAGLPAGPLSVAIRPERIAIAPAAAPAAPDRVETLGVVREAVFVGDSRRYRVEVAGGEMLAVREALTGLVPGLAPGAPARLSWPRDAMRLFAGGKAVS